jgi:dTDP-glucose 4,6-dehydratase
MKNIIITGGAGFIGSAVVEYFLNNTDHHIIVIDKLTYASNDYVSIVAKTSSRIELIEECIQNRYYLRYLLNTRNPVGIIHLAAESHVDRSISSPRPFIENNIIGTFELLEAIRNYTNETGNAVRFHHVSTDEVFGDLELTDDRFSENTKYNPSSPYSASKAASDHLVRAYQRTYGLDTVITNCSNNYGPRQHTEKLIPCIIHKALNNMPLPVYGDGKQIRDWLYVEDHASALFKVFAEGKSGETYCIGGNEEKQNIEVIKTILEVIEQETELKDIGELITYVKDRPGHDLRYAIDASKIERELGWRPSYNFKDGIRSTVKWYLNNKYIHVG